MTADSTVWDCPPCLPIQRDGGQRSRPGTNPFISVLTVAVPSVLLFFQECGHKFGTFCPEVRRGTGAFIYALSADETSPALAAFRPASTACFPAASNALALPGGNGIFTATPTVRITHYTLLRKVVCQKGLCPLWIPPQQNGAMPLAGSITPFVVSSPFHGLRVVSCKLT